MDFHWSSKSIYSYLNKYEPGRLSQQWSFNGDKLAPKGIGNWKVDWLRLDVLEGSNNVGVMWNQEGLNQKWDQVKGISFIVRNSLINCKADFDKTLHVTLV